MSNLLSKPIAINVEHYLPGQLGINTHTPRLSWQYERLPTQGSIVQVEISHCKPGAKPIIEMASASLNQNNYLRWPIQPLADREMAKIRMRLALGEDVSDWSEELFFDVGILDKFSFAGRFIGYPEVSGETDHRVQPLIRTTFHLEDEPVYARLYVSALGVVEGEMNGQRIGRDILSPGWTDYHNRVECQAYDVSQSLKAGDNALGFWLGDGWYRGRTGPVGGQVNYYGDKIGVYAQLEIIDKNNKHYTIYSNAFDNRWKTSMGPIVQSNLVEGEWYDQRHELLGWSKPNYDDQNWKPVAEVPFDLRKITFPEDAPIVPTDLHKPVKIENTGYHKWLVDFGQNCTQRVRLQIHGLNSGDELIFRHVEVLNPDKSPAIRPLRRGIQTDHFISDGRDTSWEIKFCTHGFRYVEIEGWPGTLEKNDLEAVVYHSDMKRTGHFHCSNENINQLHQNTLWSMNSNFVSIPTDCPQRDERLGWTGDIALFSPTASQLYDTTAFLSSWLRDVAYERNKYGTLPVYTPYMPFVGWTIIDALAVWGDAAVLVPWSIYMSTGDKRLLKEHYPLAKAWIDEVIGYLSKDGIWDRKPAFDMGQLGDWLDPSAPPDDPVKAMTQKELVATAFFINSCELLANMNQELALNDAVYYHDLATRSRAGFIQRFFKPNGLMTSDTQCAYTLAITFGLLKNNPTLESTAGNRLVKLIADADYTIGTGFAGTPYILPALVRTNHIETAYKLLLSEKCPSWMYQVKMGGTTTWERWDSLLPNGDINPGEMTSFNHYALGSVTNWIYTTVGGLEPLKPGWKKFKIAPRPGGGIIFAAAQHETPNGLASIKWRVIGSNILLDLTVPFSSTGLIEFVDGTTSEVGPGEYALKFPLANFKSY